MHLLCFVAKHCGRTLCIILFICGQRRTGTVFMACQVAFSALSFLTTGSFQRESWASARHLCLIACLLDMMLSNILCLVHPHLSNTTPGMREVIAVFNIRDFRNLLRQDIWRCNSHKKARHLLKCFPVSFWKSV